MSTGAPNSLRRYRRSVREDGRADVSPRNRWPPVGSNGTRAVPSLGTCGRVMRLLVVKTSLSPPCVFDEKFSRPTSCPTFCPPEDGVWSPDPGSGMVTGGTRSTEPGSRSQRSSVESKTSGGTPRVDDARGPEEPEVSPEPPAPESFEMTEET